MANEFVARNGLTALDTSRVTGSFLVTGGNVGIGTATPSNLLHVSRVGSGTAALFSSDGNVAISLSRTGSSPGTTTLNQADSGEFYVTVPTRLFFNVNSANRVLIASDGNVGIGTTAPVTTLDVRGSAYISGSVGIGTTAPNSILDASVSTGATSGFRFKGWSDSATPYLLSLGTQTYQDIFQIKSVNGLVTMGIVGAIGSDPHLAFQTNTTERMRILSGGNIGIGTTNPTGALDIRGVLYISRGQDANVTNLNINSGITPVSAFQINTDQPNLVSVLNSRNNYALVISTNDVEKVRVTSGGNVGIGTTAPNSTLQISKGAATFQITDSNKTANNTLGIYALSQTSWTISTGNSGSFSGGEKITILDSGNVGIGITTAAYRLDVSGSIRIPNSQYIYMNSVAGTAAQILGVDSGDNTIINTPTGGDIYIRSAGSTIARFISTGTVHLGGTSATSAPKVAILTGGSVGIGTTSPAYLLDVSGSARVAGSLIGDSLISAATEYRLNNLSYSRVAILDAAGAFAGGYNFKLSGTTPQHDSLGTIAGYYYQTAGSISFYTGGSQAANTNATARLVIDSSGSVGIGTTTPGARLDVNGSAYFGASDQVQIIGADNGGLTYYAANGTSLVIKTSLYNNPIVFQINSVEKVRISSSGSLGIGTNSPSFSLDVSGSGRFTDGLQVTGSFGATSMTASSLLVNGTITAQTLVVSTISSSVVYSSGSNIFGNSLSNVQQFTGSLRVTGSGNHWIMGGNVGINTTSPVSTLSVIGPDASTHTISWANQNRITGYLYSDGGGVGMYVGTLASAGIYLIENSRIDFRVSGSERVRIDSNGNVGIGTTTPGAKLDVILPANVSNNVFRSTAAENLLSIQTFPTTNRMQLLVGDYNGSATPNIAAISDTNTGIRWEGLDVLKFVNNSSDSVTINATGNVGIGTTSPIARLHINPTTTNEIALAINGTQGYSNNNFQRIAVGDIASINRLSIGFGYNSTPEWTIRYSSYHNHEFYTGNDWGSSTEKMRITSTGNVGIGTTSPTKLLHVYTSANEGIFLQGTGGGVWMDMKSAGGSIHSIGAQNNGMGIYNRTTGSYRFFITDIGNVGIGSESPGAKLDVNGNVRATSFTGSFSGSAAAPGANTQVIFNSSGSLAASSGFVFTGANIGIGTTSPTSRLYITADNSTTASIAINAGSTSVSTINFLDLIGTAGADQFIFNHYRGSTLQNYLKCDFGRLVFYTVPTAAYLGATAFNFLTENTVTGNLFSIANSATRMVVSASGFVGIGTNIPSSSLHVHTSTGPELRLSAGSNGIGGFRILKGDSGTVYLNNQDNFDIHFQIAGSTKMILNSAGNVGIGTTSPSYPFVVSNNGASGFEISTTGGINSGPFIQAYNRSTSAYMHLTSYASAHTWYIGGTRSMDLISTGNLGIGTTAPKQKLEVAGAGGKIAITNTGTTDFAELMFYEGSTVKADIFVNGSTQTTYAGANSMNIWQGSNAPMAFYTNGNNERVRIDQNGNLGIGVTSPLAKLHTGINLSDYSSQTFTNTGAIITSIGVDHTAARTNVLSLMRDGTSGVVYAGLAAFDLSRWSSDGVNARTQLDIRLANTDTATITDVLSLRSDGNVGIGVTASAARLHVSGTSGGVFEVDGVNAVNALYVSSSGNVGIGTTTPTVKLDINTDASADIIALRYPTLGKIAGIYIDSTGVYYGGGTNNYTNAFGIFHQSNYATVTTNGSERMRITTAGNVAINTTVANYKFQVNTAISSSQTYGISIQQGTNGANKDAAAFGIAVQNNGESTNAADLLFATATGGSLSERMRITSAGNVGIGSTAPAAKLDIVGTFRNAQSTNAFANGFTAAFASGSRVIDPTQPKFELWHDGTSVGQFNYSSGTLIYGTHTGGGTASNLFTILSNGNVGIGSAAPAYALDVNGTGRFTAVIETSTKEKKDNIQPYSTDTNKFKLLEPVSFTWKGSDKQDVGLIAEDVDKLFPEFVSKTEDGEVTGINYGKLTIVLINILKEQQERIERLEEQINK